MNSIIGCAACWLYSWKPWLNTPQCVTMAIIIIISWLLCQYKWSWDLNGPVDKVPSSLYSGLSHFKNCFNHTNFYTYRWDLTWARLYYIILTSQLKVGFAIREACYITALRWTSWWHPNRKIKWHLNCNDQ